MATKAQIIDFLLAGYTDQAQDQPLSGGTVEVYLAGTLNTAYVWDDRGKTLPTTTGRSTITLDAYGRAEVYGDGVYKFIIKDSGGATVETIDGAEYLSIDSGGFTVKTKAALKAIDVSQIPDGTVAYMQGRNSVGDGGAGHFFRDSSDLSVSVGDLSVVDPQEGIYVVTTGDAANGSDGAWVRLNQRPLDIRWVGASIDGVTNDTTAVNAAIAFKGDILVPVGSNGGVCLVTGPISLLSDTRLIFEEGAIFKADSDSTSHILGCSSASDSITINNPEVDGDNIRGLNGYGFGSNTTNSTNITVNNPVARNCLRSASNGGGRCYAVQNGIDSLAIISPKAYNSTSGYDFAGDATPGLKPVKGVLVVNAYGENLQELVSCYSDGTETNATSPPTQPDAVQATITSIFGRNVGRSTDTTLYSGGGTAGDKDGGVLVARRGRNLRIQKMNVFNDGTYTIGSVFRGTGNNIQIDDFEFWGDCDALAIVGTAENLLPLTASNDASYGVRMRGRHHGAATNLLDVRIATGSNFITSCDFDFEVDEFVTSNNIATTLSTFRDDSYIKVRDVINQRIIVGTLLDVFTNKNTLASATKTYSITSPLEFSGDLLVATGARVDFTDTAGASGASAGFVLVKVGGVTKKLEYFDV